MNIFQHLFLSEFLLLVVSVTALLGAESFLKEATSSGIFFWLLLTLIVSVFSSCSNIGIYGSGKVGIQQVSTFLEGCLRTFFQIAAVFFGFGVSGLTGGFVIGLIAGGIVNFRSLDLKLVRFRLSHLKSLTNFSFWIFLSASGSLVFCYADTILIGYFMSNANVGIYRTTFQLHQLLQSRHWHSRRFSIRRSATGEHKINVLKLKMHWRGLLPIHFSLQSRPVSAGGF